MEENWLKEMLETPAQPSHEHGICGCGHEGVAGQALCFICASNQAHADSIKSSVPGKEQRMYYAVYQEGYSVFGVGTTPDEAIANAKEWMDEEDGPICTTESAIVHGSIVLRPCSEALYTAVRAEGGDVLYEVRQGILCLTTEEGTV